MCILTKGREILLIPPIDQFSTFLSLVLLKFSLFYLARIVTWIAVKVFMTSPIIWSRIPMITKMRNDFKMVAFEQLKSEIT